jgi:hypothetical protein
MARDHANASEARELTEAELDAVSGGGGKKVGTTKIALDHCPIFLHQMMSEYGTLATWQRKLSFGNLLKSITYFRKWARTAMG